MGQRVNIQYTVDIDELAEEVGRLLSRTYENIRELSKDCIEEVPVLSLQTTDRLDDLRLRLGAIDHSLNDINTIIAAYLSYKASLLTPQPTPTENGAPSLEDAAGGFGDQLEELIKKGGPGMPSLEEVMARHKDRPSLKGTSYDESP